MPLVTRNVFIDTEFFVKANLDFHSRTIKNFEDLCSDRELCHLTSTIVVKEVKRKIADHIKEALKDINRFRRRAAILKQNDVASIKGFFTEINEKDFIEKALSAFDNFIEACESSIVDMSSIDGNEIIEMFFTQQTPFSEKKPNEFRDAFSLLAIRSALKGKEKVYVISADPDHKKFCEQNERFISIDTLSQLLDIYNKHNNERSRFVKEFLLCRKNDIKKIIKQQLGQADAYNASTWENAEIDSFKVVEVGDFEPNIIHLDDKSCQITFDVSVKFIVNVSGPDYVNGLYNKENGVIYTFDTSSRKEEEDQIFKVELDLSFEADVDAFINDKFELFIPDISEGIEFSVEEIPYQDPSMLS